MALPWLLSLGLLYPIVAFVPIPHAPTALGAASGLLVAPPSRKVARGRDVIPRHSAAFAQPNAQVSEPEWEDEEIATGVQEDGRLLLGWSYVEPGDALVHEQYG